MKKYLLFLLLVLSRVAFGQPGAIDPSFNPTDPGFNSGVGANSSVWSSAVQSDGKILIGGSFFFYNSFGKNRILRVNSDGNPDANFNLGTGADNRVMAIAIQPDGKIVIGGWFTNYNGTARTRIARLNSDGTLDGTFNPGTGANGDVNSVSLQSDGKLVIGGAFTTYNGTARNNIARINSDGSLDGTFDPGVGASGAVLTSVIQTDGKVIIGGQFTLYNGTARNRIARINSNGTLDGTFNPSAGANNFVYTTSLQSDGKVIIGGSFTIYNSIVRNRLARLNTDGTLDGTFDPGTAADNIIHTTTVQPDGKIVVGGNFTVFNGTARNRIARISTNGTLDGTFDPGTGTNLVVYSIALQSNGKVFLGGDFTNYNSIPRNRVVRVNSDGSLDQTFGPLSGANNSVFASSIQSDGKIVIAGGFTTYNGTSRITIARINGDGTLDGSFDPGSGTNGSLLATTIQNDGKIIIGGSFSTYNGTAKNYIARLDANGSLDGTFISGTGANSNVNTIALQLDGKIIVGGLFTSYNGTAIGRLARLNADGTLDGTFNLGTGPNGEVSTLAIQSDGKIIIGGSFNFYNGTARARIARLNSDGTLDAAFNPGTGANFAVLASNIQSDGKIILGGSFTNYNGTSRNNVARINADGTLDGTFNPGTGANTNVRTITVQSDGKIVIGGLFTTYNGSSINHIARLNSDGSLDGSFNLGTGTDHDVYATTLQPDGKIIIGGFFTSYNGTGRNRLARIFTGTLPAQTITFAPLAAKTYNNAPFLLTATASSGLPVTYVSSNLAVTTVSGNTLTIEGIGTCTITAQQTGNGSFAPAPDVPQTLTVNKASQALTSNFLSIPRLNTDGVFSPQAYYNSGLAPTIVSSNPSVATVAGGLITPVGAGTTTLTVSQPGDLNFNAATNSNFTLTVNNPAQSPHKFVIQGGAPVTQLDFPLANIEVDAAGKIYALNPGLGQVIVLNSDGSFNRTFGSFGINDGELNNPSDVAIDGNGDIYVVDASNHRIQVFGSTGNYIRKFGSLGSGSGKLNNPNSIALDGSGKAFITERTTGRVSVFTTAGVFQYAFGSQGADDGQLSIPRGIDLDGAGKVYVVDAGNSRVVVYGTAGNFIQNIGSNGSGNGQLDGPKYVKLDGTGNIVVTNDFNSRVEVFANNGTFLVNFPWPGGATGACGIGRDTGGNFYISNYGTNQLLKFSAAGTVLQTIMPLAQNVLQLHQPTGVAFDAAGNVYVGSSSSNVRVYTAAGAYIRTIGAPGAADGQFSGLPGKIAVDAAGNTYVADVGNNRVQVFDNTGAFVRNVGVGLLSAPVGLGLDAAGNIYVTDQGNDNIQIFQNNGTFVTSFGSLGSGNGQFNNAGGVAVDASGNIYVADFNNNRVQVFNNSGTFLRAFGSVGGGNGQFLGPYDIKLDASGKIYVADRNNRRIQVFLNDGTFLYNIGSIGYGLQAGNGHMSSPVSLAVTPSGLSIAVADFGNNLVQGFGASDISITPGSHNFGNVNVASSSTPALFTISNVGAAPLLLPGTPIVTVIGPNASEFSVNTSATTSPVNAASNTTFTVTFIPAAIGNRTAQLSIVSDDLDETPSLISIQGTGVMINQTITFGALASKTFGDANFNLTATASSGLTVTYVSSNPAVATISGNTVMIVGVGTSTITASQAGNVTYNAAPDVPEVLTVNKANQSITFGALAAKTFGDAAFNLTATASSGLAVSYASSNPAVATVVGNTVTVIAAGSTVITASQAGNANYNAAPNVPQTQVVNIANQTITFGALPTKTFGDPSFGLTGTASSGLAVAYVSSNPSVASVSGSTVTIVAAGTTTITASQAGNTNYSAAASVPQVLTVNKASQTITFSSLPDKTPADPPFALTATASSGLPVTYVSSNPAVAAVSGSTVTIVGGGTTTITASQPGNSNFDPATPVNQSLNVKQFQTITFGSLPGKTFGDPSFALSGTTTSGLTVTYTSSDPLVATVTGNLVTITGGGSTTITASQSGNAVYFAATDVAQTLVVAKASQVISFGAISAKTVGGAPFALGATSSSGLSIQYTSSATSKLTIAGSTATIIAAGSVTVDANQPGNASYNAASQVSQTFCINPAKPVITLSGANTESPTLTSSNSSGNQWFMDGAAIAGATATTLAVVGPGAFTVQTTVETCVSEMSASQAIIVTGDLAGPVKTEFTLFPNPAQNELHIDFRGFDHQQPIEVVIYDSGGKAIGRFTGNGQTRSVVDVRAYSSGLYLMRAAQSERVIQKQFIKR